MSIERGFREKVEEHIQDFEVFNVTMQYLNKIRSGGFEQWYLDMIIQKPARFAFDHYDAYAFMHVHSLLHSGRLGWTMVRANGAPHADIMVTENQEALADLPIPFRATFYGGNDVGDGNLYWDDSIWLDTYDVNKQPKLVPVNANSVELEVGFTKGHTTLWHLQSSSGLARWPYGSEWIYLMYNLRAFNPMSGWQPLHTMEQLDAATEKLMKETA